MRSAAQCYGVNLRERYVTALQPEQAHGVAHAVHLAVQRLRGGGQLFDHGGVLLGDGVHVGHGLVHLGDAHLLLGGGGADLAQHGADPLHRLQRLGHAVARLAGHGGASGHPLGGLANHAFDVARRLRGACGQGAHLGGHHGKAAPGLACACGLHGRIEREDVGLKGHAFDELHDVFDVPRRFGNALHGLAHGQHGVVAALGDVGGFLRKACAPAGGCGTVLHRAVDLLHGCRRLLQAAGLRFGAGGKIVVAAGDLLHRRLQVLDFLAHVAHHRAQVHAELKQRALQLAHAAAGTGVHDVREVARRELVGVVHQLFQRCNGQGACRQGRCRDGQQRHAARDPPGRAQAGGQHGQGHRDRLHQPQAHRGGGAQQPHEAPGKVLALHGAAVQCVHGMPGLRFGAHLGVQGVGRLHLLARGQGAHRQETRHLRAVAQRGDVGLHPVEVAVLAAVFHQPRPRQACDNGVPQVAESLGWHVRVADQVVGLAQQLFVHEAAHIDEGGVAVGDPALGVGDGHQGVPLGEHELGGGDGLIDPHGVSFR